MTLRRPGWYRKHRCLPKASTNAVKGPRRSAESRLPPRGHPKAHPRELDEDEELRNKEVAADRPQQPLKADTLAAPHGQLLAHWGRRRQVKQQKTEEQPQRVQRMMSFSRSQCRRSRCFQIHPPLV